VGALLKRGDQAGARGSTQVLNGGGEVVTRGSCLLQALVHGAKAVARSAFPCSS
jgi:hypothetical protein